MKNILTIIKVGGQIVEQSQTLHQLLADFAQVEGCKLLVHGGGRAATNIAARLGIESRMMNGRRITDSAMLEVAAMVYGGLVNKRIVAGLQHLGINALGLTGADLNCICAAKRPVGDVDYGFVGDVKKVNAEILSELLNKNIVPILSPLTHDGRGNLLNTNADTIAAETAKSLAQYFEVKLVFCFEKKGVLLDENDDESAVPQLDFALYQKLASNNVIKGGMLPKLENAFEAIKAGVKQVVITRGDLLKGGTKIVMND